MPRKPIRAPMRPRLRQAPINRNRTLLPTWFWENERTPGMGKCPALLFPGPRSYTEPMKTPITLLLGFAAILVGCNDKSNTPAPAAATNASGNPLTAPVDYLGAVARAQQSAVKT